MINKNIFLKKVSIVLFATAFVGCDTFLDELPDERTEINSEEKISELLVTAYSTASSVLLSESMSDNADNKDVLSENNLINSDGYHWRDNTLTHQDTPSFIWGGGYQAIAAANQALESIEKLDLSKNNSLRGEALLARAFAHFQLVVLWAKPYNEQTAKTDLAIPYVTEPEKVVFKKYERISVADFYDKIEKDILEGLPLLDDKRYKQPKFHFNKVAAHAFASRFYLMKGQWNKVLEHANLALGDNIEKKIRNIKEYNALSYSQNLQRYASSSEVANLLLVGAVSNYSRNYAGVKYGLSPELARRITSRQNHPLGLSWAYDLYGNSETNNFPRVLEYFRITNVTTQTGYPYTMTVLLTYDEVLLNRMEANLMLGNQQAFIDDLNVYLPLKSEAENIPAITEQSLNTRYSRQGTQFNPDYPITDKQKEWLQCLSDLRQIEFYHTGLRWFDNKRWGMEIVHRTDRDGNITLTKEDPRRQLQIPQDALGAGITPNPR